MTYSFTTTNVGTVTLVDVTVTETDSTGSGTVSDITCDIDVPIALAPGDVLNCTATHTITQADVDAGFVNNTALAEGFNIGEDPFTDEDDTTVQVDGTAVLDLEKDVAPTSKVAAGDEVTYTFTATNTGNVTLSDVSIEEVDFDGSGELSDLACTPEQPASLAPAAALVCTATYAVTEADAEAGSITNVATAAGTPPDGGDPIVDEDMFPEPPAPPAPAPPQPGPTASGPLPKTGSEALPLVLTSLLLLLGGSALVAGSRGGRRKATQASV